MTESRPPSPAASAAKARIEVWIAGILMVVSFAVGFIVRGVVAEEEAPPPAQMEQQIPGMPPGVIQAPPLDPNQLTGELPEGHVPVDENSPSEQKDK